MQAGQPDIEVIIPAAPGERAWGRLVEILPVHWTVTISGVDNRPQGLPPNVNWLQGRAGRGRQLNLAATAGRSRWLWFVHADSVPEASALKAIERVSNRTQDCLAYLDLAFLEDGPWLTILNGWGANLRSRLFGLPYGDQGLCLPRAWFHRLGGFRTDLERGEDLDFVIRARAAGLPLRRLPARILTSARRYRDHGWLATSWRHQVNAWRLSRSAKARLRQGNNA